MDLLQAKCLTDASFREAYVLASTESRGVLQKARLTYHLQNPKLSVD